VNTLSCLFVALGGWQRKGLPLILEALSRIRANGSVQCTLHIAGRAGRGEDFIIAPYKKWVDDGSLVLWGLMKDVTPAYKAADVLLVASYYEAFSLVMLDALKYGLPIISTPVNGSDEMVMHGQNGFVIPHTVEEWVRHLETLGGDPALRRKMGEKSQAMSGQFSATQMAKRHEELYNKLLS